VHEPNRQAVVSVLDIAFVTPPLQPEDILTKLSCLAIETSMVLAFCMYEMMVCPLCLLTCGSLVPKHMVSEPLLLRAAVCIGRALAMSSRRPLPAQHAVCD
jgi:hypothetical protein